MESKELLEIKLKKFSVNQIISKLQRGCPEVEKEICISILKKRGEDTSKWEVPNEKLGVFINEDVELTSEEMKIVEKAEIAFEKEEKPSLSKLKDILKKDKVKPVKTVVEQKSKEVENLIIGSSVEFKPFKKDSSIEVCQGVVSKFNYDKAGKEFILIKSGSNSFWKRSISIKVL